MQPFIISGLASSYYQDSTTCKNIKLLSDNSGVNNYIQNKFSIKKKSLFQIKLVIKLWFFFVLLK